jgi:hypothetical protein
MHKNAVHVLALDSLEPLPWSLFNAALNPEELPVLIRQSLDDSRDIEHEAQSTDVFVHLDKHRAEIMNRLKDSLTASQFEQLRIWLKMNRDNMSRRYELVYHAGARIGIKYAKQCESIV